jgi:hypothetical protein
VDFIKLVSSFYETPNDDSQQPAQDQNVTATADRQLLEKIWTWLTNHPDVLVGIDGEWNSFSLAEFEQLEKIHANKHNPDPDCPAANHVRLFTTEHRMWQAVAGHSADFKQIPAMEFQALCVIASFREAGIAQPDLVQLTGQDKRSLPKRTDVLAEKGYIEKIPVFIKKHKTSLLRHTRYRQKGEHSTWGRYGVQPNVFKDGRFDLDNFVNVLLDKLGDGGIATMEDIYAVVGIPPGGTWERRNVRRTLDLLQLFGIIARFRAPSDVPFARGGKKEVRYLPCVKLLRVPTAEDRHKAFFVKKKDREAQVAQMLQPATTDSKSGNSDRGSAEAQELNDDENEIIQDINHNYHLDDSIVESPAIDEANEQAFPKVEDTIVSEWDPDMSYSTAIYNILLNAGPHGLSSTLLRARCFGPTFLRPLETVLGRLTDSWESSQPPHLRHLAVIRDSVVVDRSAHFQYRTFVTFQQAVDKGETDWEGVLPKHKTPKKLTQPKLDHWGFPVLNKSHFHGYGHTGSLTLSEVMHAIKIPPKALTSRDPQLVKTAEGDMKLIFKRVSLVISEESESVATHILAPVAPKPRARKADPGGPVMIGGIPAHEYHKQYQKEYTAKRQAEARLPQIKEYARWVAMQEATAEYMAKVTSGELRDLVMSNDELLHLYAPRVFKAPPTSAKSPVRPPPELIERLSVEKTNLTGNRPELQNAPSTKPATIDPAPTTEGPPETKVPALTTATATRPSRKRRMTEKAVEMDMAIPKRPRVSIGADLEYIGSVTRPTDDSDDGITSKIPRRPTIAWKRPVMASTQRIEKLIPILAESTRTGVHINPIGSRPATKLRRGAKKALMVSFRFDWLRGLDWFTVNPPNLNYLGRSAATEEHVETDSPAQELEHQSQQQQDGIPNNENKIGQPVIEDEAVTVLSPAAAIVSAISSKSAAPQQTGSLVTFSNPESFIPIPRHVHTSTLPVYGVYRVPQTGRSRAGQESMVLKFVLSKQRLSKILGVALQKDVDSPPMYKKTSTPHGEFPVKVARVARVKKSARAEHTMHITKNENAKKRGRPKKSSLSQSSKGAMPETPHQYQEPENTMDLDSTPSGLSEVLQRNSKQVSLAAVSIVEELALDTNVSSERASEEFVRAARAESMVLDTSPQDEQAVQQHINDIHLDNTTSLSAQLQADSASYLVETSQNEPDIDNSTEQDSVATRIAKLYQERYAEPSNEYRDWNIRDTPQRNRVSSKKKGVQLGGGSSRFRKSRLVFEIVDLCEGAIGGDGEILRPYRALWLKKFGDKKIPDRVTVHKAVKNLVDQGKLKKVAFLFEKEPGKSITKHILLRSDIKFDSPVAQAMVDNIKKTHPRQFLPEHLDTGEESEKRKPVSRFLQTDESIKIVPRMADWNLSAGSPPADSALVEDATPWEAQFHSRLKALAEVRNAQFEHERQNQRHASDQKPDEPNAKRQKVVYSSTAFATASNIYRTWKRRATSNLQAPSSSGELIWFQDPTLADAIEEEMDREEAQVPGRAVFSMDMSLVSNNPWRSGHQTAQPTADFGARKRRRSELKTPEIIDQDEEPGVENANAPVVKKHRGGYPPSLRTWNAKLPSIRNIFLRPAQKLYTLSGTFSTEFTTAHWRWKYHHDDATDRRNFPRERDFVRELNIIDGPDVATEFDFAGQSNLVDELDFADQSVGDLLDAAHKEAVTELESWGSLLKVAPPTELGFLNFTMNHHHNAPAFNLNGPYPLNRKFTTYTLNPHEAALHFGNRNFSQSFKVAEGSLGVVQVRRPGSNYRVRFAIPEDAAEKPRNGQRRTQQWGAPIDPRLVAAKTPKTPRVPKVYKKQAADPKCIISPEVARTLLYSVIIVRTLAGGLDQMIKWKTIEELFNSHPHYCQWNFKYRWIQMQKSRPDIVNRLQDEFEDAYLAAYEKGEVPQYDLSTNGSSYDWAGIIDWAMRTVIVAENTDQCSVQDLIEQKYDFLPEPPASLYLREDFLRPVSTVIRRVHAANAIDYSLSCTRESNPSELLLARSWVRAAINEGDEITSNPHAAARLQSFDEKTLRQAIESLLADKVIISRSARKFGPFANHDQLPLLVKSRQYQSSHFSEAIAFKDCLDKFFRSGKVSVSVSQGLTNSEIMALSEMLLSGRLRTKAILPQINHKFGDPFPRLSVWGLNDGGYEAKKIDRQAYFWPVEISPTDNYVYGHPIQDTVCNVPIPMKPAEDDESRARIPYWVNFRNSLDVEKWRRAVLVIVQGLALKAGCNAATLVESLKKSLEEWEVELILQWLQDVGVARQIGGTWCAAEYWWMVVPCLEFLGESDESPVYNANEKKKSTTPKK